MLAMANSASSQAALIRARLAELGWTLQDLTTAAHVGKNTVGDFLNGRTVPYPSTLAKLENALGLTPGTLSNSDQAAPPPVTSAAALSDAELVTELAYRLENMRRAINQTTNASD